VERAVEMFAYTPEELKLSVEKSIAVQDAATYCRRKIVTPIKKNNLACFSFHHSETIWEAIIIMSIQWIG